VQPEVGAVAEVEGRVWGDFGGGGHCGLGMRGIRWMKGKRDVLSKLRWYREVFLLRYDWMDRGRGGMLAGWENGRSEFHLPV
jgi:hypothetical protein